VIDFGVVVGLAAIACAVCYLAGLFLVELFIK